MIFRHCNSLKRNRKVDILFTKNGDATGDTIMIMVVAIFDRMRVAQALSQKEQKSQQGRNKAYGGGARHGALPNYIAR